MGLIYVGNSDSCNVMVKALEEKEKNVEMLTSKLKEATEALEANEKLLRDVNDKVRDCESHQCWHRHRFTVVGVQYVAVQ